MGVQIYLLADTGCVLRIGSADRRVGILERSTKITEVGLRDRSEVDDMEALLDHQATGRSATPPVVVVAGRTRPWRDSDVEGHAVRGWDSGRLMTQDLGWDHLPLLGWAIPATDGRLALWAELDGEPRPVSGDDAVRLGILDGDGDLLPYFLPTIVDCRGVRKLGSNFWEATCRLSDGRTVMVLGETETGDLPTPDWLAGRTPKQAAHYRAVDLVAMRR